MHSDVVWQEKVLYKAQKLQRMTTVCINKNCWMEWEIPNKTSRDDINKNATDFVCKILLSSVFTAKWLGVISLIIDNNNNRLTAFVPGQPGQAGTRRNTLP